MAVKPPDDPPFYITDKETAEMLMKDDALTRKEAMKLFRADIYRDHIMTELLVQAFDVDDAKTEIKRAWQGWDIRGVVEALPMTRTWKIGAWTTD